LLLSALHLDFESFLVAPKSVNIVPANLVFIGDTMYYIEDKIERNWFTARQSCESMGYNLISLDSNEKIKAINNYLDNRNDKFIYWTSGNDFLTLGRHVWFPSGKPVAKNLWHPGEPNNVNNVEHCDEFGFTKARLMNDRDCTAARRYICERTLN
ncbi:hypothetical protein KR054_000262, partial [Drosophila jambulina]